MDAPLPAMPGNADPPHAAVDDAPEIRELRRELFEDAGYEVATFPAPPPLDRLAALRPDAIVQDFRFLGGRCDGWDLLAAIRRDPALARAPLVVWSAGAGCLEDGAGRGGGGWARGRCRSRSTGTTWWPR